jgi:hypothetical protein
MSAAVTHLLRQMQRDGRLAYLIGPMSQSYDLLTLEAARAAGRGVGEFRIEFEATLKFERWVSETALRDRMAELLSKWEKRSRDALPVDGMLINKHIRELLEALEASTS